MYVLDVENEAGRPRNCSAFYMSDVNELTVTHQLVCFPGELLRDLIAAQHHARVLVRSAVYDVSSSLHGEGILQGCIPSN